MLSENDVEAILATFCCYDYGANALEDRYRLKRLSQMLFLCYILLKSQNILVNNSEKKVGY